MSDLEKSINLDVNENPTVPEEKITEQTSQSKDNENNAANDTTASVHIEKLTINESDQENSLDLVQDMTEESEVDLQMVLNKVSETLKSLNQNVLSTPEDSSVMSLVSSLNSTAETLNSTLGQLIGDRKKQIGNSSETIKKGDDTLSSKSNTAITLKKLDTPSDQNLSKTTEKMLESVEQTATITALDAPPSKREDILPKEDVIKSSAVDKPENDIFYNKECVNIDCERKSEIFCSAIGFVLSYYLASSKSKQYICHDCYDKCINKYEEWNNTLHAEEPLILTEIPKKKLDFVEILDSDDEDCNEKRVAISQGKSDFDKTTLDLIENELGSIIESKFKEVGIHNQLSWYKQSLSQRFAKQLEDCEYITKSINLLQKSADSMYNSLYKTCKNEVNYLAPFDLNTGKQFVLGSASQINQFIVPPVGEIERPPIKVGNEYFAVKNKVMASWLPCKVIEIIEFPGKETTYKVKYTKIKLPTFKNVTTKHMSYNEHPTVQLTIGTRVLALFDSSTLYRDGESNRSPDYKSVFYPGIIAEALQSYNNFRYLIFFDDGYTQYVHHRDVRLICETSSKVWEDIHESSREFIQNYLINYKKNRPMVQVKKGQSMITELNGKWIYAKVIDVDASLIQMQFETQKNYTEWIYRGSTRLGPLFKALQKTDIPVIARRRNEPFVRYMQDDENTTNKTEQPAQVPTQPIRAVAKKTTTRQTAIESTSQPPQPAATNQPIKHLNDSVIFIDEEPKGKLVYYSAKIDSNPPPRRYSNHGCDRSCITRKVSMGCNYGVLSKPLLNGWQRAIYKENTKKRHIVYTAPCGRRLRNMEEVHRFLRLTKVLGLNVENFVFDPECGCLTEYQVQKCIVNKPDLSDGVEPIPIQCINYYDHTMPPSCDYSAERIPTEGVNLNTEPEFLVGCDCDGDCTDKSKCSCWQLTLLGAKFSNPLTPPDNVGYFYKRLLDPVTTGIYECNVRCKCAKTCINRVVQHPLETKLQTFKTSNRGWGLRCINDIPKGAFICIYAGELLTEQKANEANSGDEYFAELDYIEVAERLKEGYESEPEIPEDLFSEDENDYTMDDDDKEFSTKAARADQQPLTTRSNQRARAVKSTAGAPSVSNDDDEEEQERIAINFDPKTSLDNIDEAEESSNRRYKPMRKLFGKDEFIYVMDAKKIGNVGRYFNHSCSPNLFVQNVFVDTQDLRFPWVAFFALSQIRAGTELTWNYNYEVGVVPGKVLYCQCGAPNCRGRLL